MVAPLTPNPTRKAETLVRVPPTIVASREEDAALKEVALPRYRHVNCILETKTNVGSTAAKAPAPRTNPNINKTPTSPKSHTHPSHETMVECVTQRRRPPHRHPSQSIILFYYESRKRELKTRLTHEDRCDERLKN
jgi:hypothetical protein